MRCFNHSDKDAVGLCKACCKGLCHDCATDLEHGIACRGKHEPAVQAAHTMVVRAARIQSTTKRAKYVSPAFCALMGAIFVGYGYFRDGVGSLLFILGGAFLIYSVVVFAANRRAYAVDDGELRKAVEKD